MSDATAEHRLPAEAAPAPPAALSRFRTAVEQEMRDTLRGGEGPLYAMQRYHLGWEDAEGRPIAGAGGKIFRPALCLLCCQALGGDPDRALPGAAALELLHNFSLIHDDIEDRSSTRHGRRTLWDLWGVELAVNAGDAMFTAARLALHRLSARDYAPQTMLNAFLIFDRASQRLCEGQDTDLRFEQRTAVSMDEYLAMIAGKTGALIGTSAAMGALLAEQPGRTVGLFDRFGRLLGRAFQIQDDALGVWGVEARTGKPSGDDIRARKKAYPITRALEVAQAEDRALLGELYARPELDDRAVAEVLAIFERNGIREDAARAARQTAGEALALLHRVELREPARSELFQLATFVAEREA
ncbi:MAG TPA: polyprenyl synthetase family protein [Dehalococcoidia bacterium]|nr:polyprenyl synthetase family protein [Dehalococcoidia bacterium]